MEDRRTYWKELSRTFHIKKAAKLVKQSRLH